jgi:hypothetical protein
MTGAISKGKKIKQRDIAVLKAGDKMPDGTTYVGISPTTHKPMYTTPNDVPTERFNIQPFAEAYGHKDWREPTKEELNLVFRNHDKGQLKNTFNETGSYPKGYYRTSSPNYDYTGWNQRFSDGDQSCWNKCDPVSLRPVRCDP